MARVDEVKNAIRAARDWWQRPTTLLQSASLEAGQLQLLVTYRTMLAAGQAMPSLPEVGFGASSENDEDGILLYLYGVLGMGGRRLVDIGAASVIASNSANLLRHHGWTGLLVDGDGTALMATKRSYGHRIGTGIETVQEFVTAENVNDVVRAGAGYGAVDLLSIDIDGMDYWVWKALDCIAPRVVVIEVQDLLGPERSVVVPYSPSFAARSHSENAELLNYAGASLTAMVKLGHEKGYRFVGTSRIGYNAFFIRGDVAPDWLREPSPAECLMHPWNRYGEQVRWPLVSHLPWQEV